MHTVRTVDIRDPDTASELGLSAGDHVMVMRYAPGVSLSRWRRQFAGAIVPCGAVVEVARQLASALDAAERGAEALASIPDDDDAGDDDARSLADAVSEKVLWMETNATVRASLADAEGAFSAKFSEAENAGVRELAPNACARIDELVASAERKRDSGDFAGAKADYDLAAYMLGKAVVGGKRLRANSGVEAAEEFKRREQWRQCYEAADAVLSNWDMLNARARALKSEAWDRMNSVPGPAPDSTDALNAFSAPSRRK